MAGCDALNPHKCLLLFKGCIMSNQAISQELNRVRALKRALSSEVELLRSNMENGKIHLRISQDKNFRLELAKTMIEISHLGYSKEYQGWYVCDPIKGKIYYRSHSSFPQYSESIEYRIVRIENCFCSDASYALNINWYERIEEMSNDFQTMISEYIESDENLEPDDFDKELFVEWVKSQAKYDPLIQTIEEDELDEAISFAYGEILDEVIVEI